MCMYYTKGINQNGYMLCRYCNMMKDMHPIFIYIYNITYQCDDIILLIQDYIKVDNYNNIACGDRHSIALLQDNTVQCWGNNKDGQCNVPDSIQGNNNNMNGMILSIACGRYHSCALLNNMTVICWGNNNAGQCDVPYYIQGKIISIDCGSNFSCALLNDNTVICWGSNMYGQCNLPDSIQGKVVSIECGRFHCVALLNDNSIICWGCTGRERGQKIKPIFPCACAHFCDVIPWVRKQKN